MAEIYVIDDDDQLLRMVGLMLERGGHNPTLFADPRQGLAQIKEKKPDLLVLDVMMPGMSGHDVCQEIRATEEIADTRIIILTARAQAVDRATALQSGADDYLSKPVVAQELLAHVEEVLGRQPAGAAGEEKKGFVVSLMGFRGGVGRTTLAVNLAAAMRLLSQQTVCLVDLGVAGGQVAWHLRLPARPDWSELFQADRPTEEQFAGTLLEHRSGLKVLAAPRLPQPANTPTAAQVQGLVEWLQQETLFSVIDLPPLSSPAVHTALTLSDMVLHVVTPDVVSVQVAVQANRMLAQNQLGLKQRVFILNKVTPEDSLPAQVVERGLSSRLAFTVEYDSNQARALAQGMPLALTNAQSPLPQTVRRMAEALRSRVAQG